MRFSYLLATLLVLTSVALAQPLGQVSPTSLDFGSVLLKETSPEMIVSLKNTGNANMVVSNVSVTGLFTVAVNKCQNRVKVGTHCNVWIAYSPQSVETDTGTLTFADDATNSPQTVSLTGAGVDFQLLYQFRFLADYRPISNLIMDAPGNFYGVASGRTGGSIFKLSHGGKDTVLYEFGSHSDDGTNPCGGLMMDAQGNLYGTTQTGGDSSYCNYAEGCGTVFKLGPDGTETVLYNFGSSPNDGAYPVDSLIMDAQGNLYGTTSVGGPNLSGIVFKVTPGGTETVVYNFCSLPECADGSNPYSDLVTDTEGNFYGTTGSGGTHGFGTVFKLTSGGTETVLYSFSGAPNDGAYPGAGLIMDSNGNFYGTTEQGGTSSNCNYTSVVGCGTVFKLTPSGAEAVLYSFNGSANDGAAPGAALIVDAQGNLYGTTIQGGSAGGGTVFMLTPSGTETVLHSFSGYPSDGASPFGSLVMDEQGNLYGTTFFGGGFSPYFCFDHTGCGTVFGLVP